MSLRDTLKNLVESVEGGLSAVIMAYDGISIDEATVVETDIDVQLLAVEYATVVKEIKRAAEVIKSGDLEEVSITTTDTRIIIRVLTDELFVVLITRKDGNYGKARFMLKLRSFDLVKELA